MSSSYTDGTRIALDITEKDRLNSEAILEIIQAIQQNCGDDVPLSTHLIETESSDWGKEGSPWSKVDSRKAYQMISDELILAHHHIECI